jgi:hypothetical protein
LGWNGSAFSIVEDRRWDGFDFWFFFQNLIKNNIFQIFKRNLVKKGLKPSLNQQKMARDIAFRPPAGRECGFFTWPDVKSRNEQNCKLLFEGFNLNHI